MHVRIFSSVPAFDDGIPGHGGCIMAQIYVGISSWYKKVYPMRSKDEVPKMYVDFLGNVGAPLGLYSDGAKENYSEDMKTLHRLYGTTAHFSEPHYQNQNPVELAIQEVKRVMGAIMNAYNVPDNAWLLCLQYTVFLLNRTSLESLDGLAPLSVAFGGVTDISPILAYHFWANFLFTGEFP